MYKKMEKRAVTLTEVIVGSIILAAVFGSLLATFVGAKKYVTRANRRLVSANLGRSVLDTLYADVRADTWDNGRLAPGPHADEIQNLGIDIYDYSGSYDVTGIDINDDGVDDYRQVDVDIIYPNE